MPAILISKPGSEVDAQRVIVRAGFEAWLPQFWDDKRGAAKVLFPRYLFVWLQDGLWWKLLSMPFVSDVLRGAEGAAAELDERYVVRLRRRCDERGFVQLPKVPERRGWRQGQVLRVKDRRHILGDRAVVFSGMSGADRVKVLLHWLGRDQEVVLDRKLLIAI